MLAYHFYEVIIIIIIAFKSAEKQIDTKQFFISSLYNIVYITRARFI